MTQLSPVRRKPLAATVLAVVLAFAVVCPLMAAPGVPADQGCHSGSAPAPGGERASVCCSSVTIPKLLAPDPSPAPALATLVEAAPEAAKGTWQPDASPAPREPRPPLFVRHAALLI